MHNDKEFLVTKHMVLDHRICGRRAARSIKRATIAGLTLGLAACADSSDKIAASYVSPLVYQDYSCSQLGAELARVTARVSEVAGVQDDAASDDAAVMGVGLLLFWPTLFLLEGDTGREAELGRLKGEVDAIERAAAES